MMAAMKPKGKMLLVAMFAAPVLFLGCKQSFNSAMPTARKVARQERMFFAGSLNLGVDIKPFETTLLKYSPAVPMQSGDTLAAQMSQDEAWSVDTSGTEFSSFPLFGMVRGSDGKSHALNPAKLTCKAEIKAGVTNSDGYLIVAKRRVMTGESIPIFDFGSGMVSIEAADNDDTRPWFGAFKEKLGPEGRASLVEAWAVARADRPRL